MTGAVNGERGSVLVYAMLLGLVIGAASALLFTRGRTVRQEATTDVMRDAAFHAAEGGLEHARHELAKDPAFAGAEIEIGDCRVTSNVTRTGRGWQVRVTAHPGSARIEATLVGDRGLPEVARWE